MVGSRARHKELGPGPEQRDRTDLEADLRRRLMLIYHPAGTCRMSDGGDEAVVDSRMSALTQGERHRHARLAAVLEGSLVKVVSWYDNGWSYSNRCVELAQWVPVRAYA